MHRLLLLNNPTDTCSRHTVPVQGTKHWVQSVEYETALRAHHLKSSGYCRGTDSGEAGVSWEAMQGKQVLLRIVPGFIIQSSCFGPFVQSGVAIP